ncbi:two-component system sensor histidine kinase NtrB [Fluviispira multicolorata]|uniref:histidine kinase n=1 Tax=Fluviispira multicolorata TaxID=2654512 RepID=A0A833JI66_9BACT|nr:PAS domain S-box protein [Fluviispira multicolorata]KAB8033737.1 PAS domain S-box protein [Fluviispira multicolorata]
MSTPQNEDISTPITLIEQFPLNDIILKTIANAIDEPGMILDFQGNIELLFNINNYYLNENLNRKNIFEINENNEFLKNIKIIYDYLISNQKSMQVEYTSEKNNEYFQICGTLIENELLNKKFIIIKIKDITSIKKYEKQLQSAVHFYEKQSFALNEAASISITDRNGNIIFVNDKFTKLTGYNVIELIGKNHKILNSNTHSKTFFADLWKTLLRGEIWKGEIQNKNKNGNLYWIESTIVPIKNEDNEIIQFVSIRFDITEKKNKESLIIHATNMSYLGEMAGNLAHEINNPLTIISGKIFQLERDLSLNNLIPEKLNEQFNIIDLSLARISKIVNEFLKFSRHSDYEPLQSICVDHLINNALDFCKEKFRTHGIELYLSDFISTQIRCKPTKILQVILNLLNNSFDAILNLPDKWIEISVCENENNFVSIIITDSGLGIAEEIQSKIFMPFFSNKSNTHGLGLCISKNIIDDHKGIIQYDVNSKNTRFIISLNKN